MVLGNTLYIGTLHTILISLTLILVARAADDPLLSNPCLENGIYASRPWCDPTLPLHERVRNMISYLSLAEKMDALGSQGLNPIRSLGLPAYNWWSESTHGVATDEKLVGQVYTTNFAFPITTAMSFNRSLWKATGHQIGREARALMNAGMAYSTFWAPVINLAREPRWGRNLETPGEDPLLTGEYATHFVKGMQEAPEDPYHLQASACCKHFIANSMDGTDNWGQRFDRNHVDSEVGIQDLVDTYMPPFQACIVKGGVSGLMCSYNAVNGVPSCANDWLLDKVARQKWGFDGYVASDCDADRDVFFSHNYTKTKEEAVRDVLRAGTDVDCGKFVQQNVDSTLQKGEITVADINERLTMLFKVRMRLGHFDPVGPLQKIPLSTVCSEEAKATAREGSIQGSTLVKNNQNALPLKRGLKVAVIGPNAIQNNPDTAKYYAGTPCDGVYHNMVDAVAQYAEVKYAPGLEKIFDQPDEAMLDSAARAAELADEVVLVLGTDLDWAEEGSDAKSIAFNDGQLELISKVLDAAPKPVIVVMMTHIPLDLTLLLEDDRVGAILHTGQPSVQTLGIGDLLFGVRAPAGRLIQTVYPEEYQHSVSILDFGMRPGPSNFPRPDCQLRPYTRCPKATNPGRTHRFYTGKAVLPFGHGLSYSKITYSHTLFEIPSEPVSLDVVRSLLAANEDKSFIDRVHLLQEGKTGGHLPQFSVKVTNHGPYHTDHVVLSFAIPPHAGSDGIPIQNLIGFERVHLKVGETKEVWVLPVAWDFTQIDQTGRRYVHAGNYTFKFGVQTDQGEDYAEHTILMA